MISMTTHVQVVFYMFETEHKQGQWHQAIREPQRKKPRDGKLQNLEKTLNSEIYLVIKIFLLVENENMQ